MSLYRLWRSACDATTFSSLGDQGKLMCFDEASMFTQIWMIAIGCASGVGGALLAAHNLGHGIQLLSILYALLLSAIYYVGFPLRSSGHCIGYVLGCGLTGYLLGFLESSFLA
jgi:hypothetical protein